MTLARILHVEDNPEWIGVVQRALPDYQLDSAGTYGDALALIRSNPPYDLALVDLSLERDDDGLGGEILDLLKLEYPSTHRVVVTGRPPIGSVRANIYDRYGADEILIKGQLNLPDLRRVISKCLTESLDELPQAVGVRKAMLTQRYRDWRDHVEATVQERLVMAQEYARNAGKLHGQAIRRAQDQVEKWIALRDQVKIICSHLEETFSGIQVMNDCVVAIGELDRAETKVAEDIRALANETSAS